ncbi:MAG: SUMF1/EgtB/PvdO family nonheme iron enzyme [Chloroflexales bacterium]|nr:SUMF1/EgtB/PvdO family nonheme iron enzyme [Chloroflexales bacterium]
MRQTRLLRCVFGVCIAVLCGMAALPVLPPAVAQTPPAATASTPGPTVTPTRTAAEIIGAGDVVTTGTEIGQRWEIFGALGLLLLGAAFFVLQGFARKTGEGLADFFYRIFLGRWFDRRVKDLDAQNQQRLDKRDELKARQLGLAAYFDWLQEELKHLPIIPIRSTERQEQLLLDDVYVPLRVVERAQIEGFRKLVSGNFDPEGEYQVRREAYEALAGSLGVYHLLSDPNLLAQLKSASTDDRRDDRQRRSAVDTIAETATKRLLLVGDAGSGKTTTLQYGALVLTHDCCDRGATTRRDLLDLHTATTPVPFYIRLTLVATYVREAQQRAQPEELPGLQGAPSTLLLNWLDSYIVAQVARRGATIASDFPSHQLAAGDCLVMLDGLDETGDARERNYMQGLIANLVQDYPQNRYLVASRPFEELQLPGFVERHLSPLNREEIARLLRNWFGAVRKVASRRPNETAEEQVAYLSGILDHNARLFEMATNPLLLTSMALLVHTGVGLPRERAELYNRLIYLLLDTWRTQQITGGIPGRDDRRARYGGEETAQGVQRRLQELAAWMQEHGRRELRLHEAQRVLRPVYAKLKQWDNERAHDYIATLLESLALESGLIQRRDSGYSFAHYTLQEYLTARAYDLRDDGVSALHQHWTKPRWRETILLAVGHWATDGYPDKARQLLQQLLDDSGSSAANQIDAVLLAAQALDDADAGRVVELAPLRNTTIERLRAGAFDPQIHPDPVIRNRAATMLDRLDADNERPGLDLTQADYWAERIEPGTFSMGDDDGQYNYTIRQPYALARFPVTNRQYLIFVEALAGRGTTEAVAAARQLQALMAQHQQTPEDFHPRYWPGARYRAGAGNHPVVGVTWYAAMACAWWVDAWLHAQELLKDGEAIRLPTEAEWERAAAYPLQLRTLRHAVSLHSAAAQGAGGNSRAGRREYPWGDWPDLTKTTGGSINAGIPANIAASEINATSVVGIFPHGAAACGAEEMAGNVWEWCNTPFVVYPFKGAVSAESPYNQNKRAIKTYVLRGGSWYYDRDYARCAYRNDLNPDIDAGAYGFRLAHLFSLPSS